MAPSGLTTSPQQGPPPPDPPASHPASKSLPRQPDESKQPDPPFQSPRVRTWIVLAFWVVVAFALPGWWRLTTIERLALPVGRVEAWKGEGKGKCPLRLPVNIQLSLHSSLTSGKERPFAGLGGELETLLSTELSRAGGPRSKVGEEDNSCLDFRVSVGNDGKAFSSEAEIYTVLVRDLPPGHEPRAKVVQGRTLEVYVTPGTGSLADLPRTVSSHLAPLLRLHPRRADPRVVKFSPSFRLVFSLMNEDVTRGGGPTGWEVEDAIRVQIQPFLERLGSLHNFTVESQVQYYAPLSFEPHRYPPLPSASLQEGEDGDDSVEPGLVPDEATSAEPVQFWYLEVEQLKTFVSSAEWSLASPMSSEPVLHFILYVPAADRRPLRLRAADGTLTNTSAFLVPQWGGVMIYHPHPEDGSSSDLGMGSSLKSSQLAEPMSILLAQLRTLLGMPSSRSASALSTSLAADSEVDGLEEWVLDALMRSRTLDNARESADTLASIVKLVAGIGNMRVGTEVRDDVRGALDELDKTAAALRTSLPLAFAHSSSAHALSSRAFFHPSMLGLLYFPDEHKYAVYTPLFGPITVPLIVALAKEVKEWRERRKRRPGARAEGEGKEKTE